MEDTQRFKAEMFMRVAEIGAVETAVFPPSSLGGRLFVELNVVRAELDKEAAKQASGRSSAEQGTTSRGEGLVAGESLARRTHRRRCRKSDRTRA